MFVADAVRSLDMNHDIVTDVSDPVVNVMCGGEEEI